MKSSYGRRLRAEQLEARQMLTTNGFTGDYVLDNWSAESLPNGTTSMTPASGAATAATFGYNADLDTSFGSFDQETADFLAPSTVTGSVRFDYNFTGNSRYALAEAQFSTVTGGTFASIIDQGTSGPFDFSGSASLIAQQGQDFGFRIGGGNGDSINNIFGNLTITNLVVNDSIVVDTNTDVDDGDFSSGNLSLREAIGLANSIPGVETISFAAGVGEAFESGGVIRLSNMGELVISSDVTIDGSTAGGEVVITGDVSMNDTLVTGSTVLTDAITNSYANAADNVRVFRIASGTANLNNLTITGGVAQGADSDNDGGGIRVDAGATLNLSQSAVSGNAAFGRVNSEGHGGGIANYGTTYLTEANVSSNIVGGDRGAGGGIFSPNSAITLTNTTVSDNRTLGELAVGGGIAVDNGALTLVGSTLSNNSTQGTFSHGGGISADSSTVTLTNSTVSGNSTTGENADSGGIDSVLGSLTLTDSTVSGNSSNRRGGGITGYNSALTLTNSNIIENSTAGRRGDGGGVFLLGEISTIINSTVSRNSTTGDSAEGGGIFLAGALALINSTVNGNSTTGNSAEGGGIFVSSSLSELTLINSTVSGNSTTGESAGGGGIYTQSGDVTLSSSTVSGNSTAGASAEGGGISSRLGALTLSNSTVSGNSTAVADGGGIATIFGALTLSSSTVARNSSGGDGGGIFDMNTPQNPKITVQNSIFAQNTSANSSPNLHLDPESELDIDYSLIDDTSGSSVTASTGTGNFLNIFPSLGPLADNGGPTQTHNLQPGSPAIDAGDPAAVGGVGNVPFFDQRGLPELRVRDGRIDMGAVESPGTASVSLVVSTTTDEVDNNSMPGQLSLREALFVANSNTGPDTITFDPAVFTGGVASVIRLNGTELTISDDVTIDGSTGTEIVITADSGGDDQLIAGTQFTDAGANTNTADNSRAFNITAGRVNLSGVTVTGGFTTGNGGGLLVGSGATLNLAASSVSGNVASGSGDGYTGNGGGIANYGITSISGSTIAGNSGFYGGGVLNSSDDSLTITGTTISGNDSVSDGGGVSNFGTATLTNVTVSGNTTIANGGGVFNGGGDTLVLNNSTVFGNIASGAGSGAGVHNSGDATLNNTIVAGSTSGEDLFGSFSGSFNLIEDGSGTGLSDTISSDPLLAPLADNGGPTRTHALPLGSPAINTGDPNFDANDFTPPLLSDQRGDGFKRVAFGRIDIGALEAAQFDAPATGTDILLRQLTADPTQLEILLDGTVVVSLPTTQPDDLRFVSSASQDQSLTVDYTNGYFDSTGAISFAGNAGDNDQLRVIGDSAPRRTRATYNSTGTFGIGTLRTANGGVSDTIAFSDLSTLDISSVLSMEVDDFLPIATGQSLTVDTLGFVGLDTTTLISGGALNVVNGITLGSGESLVGTGAVNSIIAAGQGSTIQAEGSFVLGNANSVIGYESNGVLHAAANTVTINDANEAVLGSLTTLGDGITGGRLVAGTATPNTATDNTGLPDDFLLEDGKNVTGRGSIYGNFRNMGSVIGDANADGQRIVFEDGFTVSGIGFAQNVVYNGTFAPGLSPGIAHGENMAFAGNVQIELGGTTPGTGHNSHDQINDTGATALAEGASLEILPWNGFQPSVGDQFEILLTAGQLTGRFESVTVDEAFTNNGIDFQLHYTDNTLTLAAVAASTRGDFDTDGDVDGFDFLAWQRGFGTTTDADDLNDWRSNYGQQQVLAATSDDVEGEVLASVAALSLATQESDSFESEPTFETSSIDEAFSELDYSANELWAAAAEYENDSTFEHENNATRRDFRPALSAELVERVFS